MSKAKVNNNVVQICPRCGYPIAGEWRCPRCCWLLVETGCAYCRACRTCREGQKR